MNRLIKFLTTFLLFCAFTSVVSAQGGGDFTHANAPVVLNAASSSAQNCSPANSCNTVYIPAGSGSATFYIQPSTVSAWSGVVSFEGSMDGGNNWVAISVTPSNSSTTVTTTSAGGGWQFNPGAYTAIRMRMSTYTSGQAVTTTQTSTASAQLGGGTGGGGGSGTVTEVDTAAPLAGGPITSSGTISITGAAGQVLAGAGPAFTATPSLGTDNSVAGTLQLANSAANAHTIFASGATTSNTIKGFATVPVTTDLITCVVTTTVCQLTDSGSTTASFANAALSNLASVSINTSLLAQTGVDAGSTTKPFRNLFLWGTGTYGTTYEEITGAPTSTRVWTLQDATDTLVGRATTDTLTNKSISGAEINSSTVGNTYGGTGANSSAATGVAQVASGTWSFSTALANGTTCTTQSASDNSTKCATTAYADAEPGTGANKALSNLASVAVSLALTPGTDNSISEDSLTKRFINYWSSGVFGFTNGSGTATTGLSQDSSDVLDCGNGTATDTSCTLQLSVLKTVTNGTDSSQIQLAGNSANFGLGSNLISLYGPSSATFTAYGLQFSATGPAGAGVALIGAPSTGVSQVTFGTVPNADLTNSATTVNGQTCTLGSTCTISTGLISGLTTGFLPKASSSTAIANSLCDEGITTANVLTCTDTGGAKLVSVATGTSPPTCTAGTGGATCYTEGTAATAASSVDDVHGDSTQHAAEVNNNNTGEMSISRTACVNVTPVTVAANVTTDQLLQACSFNANLLNVIGRTLKVDVAGVFSTAAASVASLTFKVKLCTVSGCGSGTVISPIIITTGATSALTASNLSFGQTSLISTQTAGSSSAYEAHGSLRIDLSATAATPDSLYQDTNTSTVGTVDSTGALFLQVTVAASAGSTSNSFTERQLIVEVLN